MIVNNHAVLILTVKGELRMGLIAFSDGFSSTLPPLRYITAPL